MQCLHPTQFQNNGYYVQCGQCMPCRITRKSEWTTKLLLEYKTFPKAVFATLTYSPEHLPESKHFVGGSLHRADLQKFMKRFRKNYNSKYGQTKVRYFGVGEYGDKSERAHYHIILFNVEPDHAEHIIQKSWTLGHTRTDLLNEHRIKYTVGYCLKKMTGLEHFPDGREPEFSLKSKNPALGWYAIPQIADVLKKHGFFPSRSIDNESSWIMEQEGFQPKLWNGVFYIDKSGNLEFPLTEEFVHSKGSSYCRLDRSMMAKLAEYMAPLQKDYIKARMALLEPKEYKSRKSRLISHSYLDKMKFVESEDYYATQKKSEKIKRQSKSNKIF